MFRPYLLSPTDVEPEVITIEDDEDEVPISYDVSI